MEAAGSSSPRHAWGREGRLRRVALGGVTGFAGGALYATARAMPPAGVLRGGVACGLLSAPFFALRDVFVTGLHVEGPVASTITGGIAGYLGALFMSSGPHWKTVSHSAVAVGMGCGLVDVIMSRLDWQRKVYLVNRHDAAVAAAANAVGEKEDGSVQRSNSFFKLPSWLPGLKEIDDEYHDLLRRQEATVVALEKEQARIAVLLEALDRVKAAAEIIDPEKAQADLPSPVSPQVPLSPTKDHP